MKKKSEKQKSKPISKAASSTLGKTEKVSFCTSYRHYRTGKVMKASEYGYKAWHFGKN